MERFNIEGLYKANVITWPANALSNFDFIITSLDNGKVYQSFDLSNPEVWEETSNYVSQPLLTGEYYDYIKTASPDFDYIELIFDLEVHSIAQEQGNELVIYLFSFDYDRDFITLYQENFTDPATLTGQSSLLLNINPVLDLSIYDQRDIDAMLSNLYVGFEYYSRDKSKGLFSLDFSTDSYYLESSSTGDTNESIYDTYNYFMFNNNLAADNKYNSGYESGYNTGYNSGYDLGYDGGYDSGYDIGYNEGYNEGSDNEVTFTFGKAIEIISTNASSLLQTEILPNFTIGNIIFIPVVFSLLGIILKIFRR